MTGRFRAVGVAMPVAVMHVRDVFVVVVEVADGGFRVGAEVALVCVAAGALLVLEGRLVVRVLVRVDARVVAAIRRHVPYLLPHR